jgi:hypothetical protein
MNVVSVNAKIIHDANANQITRGGKSLKPFHWKSSRDKFIEGFIWKLCHEKLPRK